MTLTITKREIEEAIEMFIKDKGYMRSDKDLKINIICGRGEKGLRAEVEEITYSEEITDTKEITDTEETEDTLN
jgi:hypothetical protein